MRYQAAEKLEIIQLVERSHLSVRWTLDQIAIPCATFYRWHDLRHTAASWMMQSGVPLDVVRQILGHKDIAATTRSAHRVLEAKRDAVDAIASHRRHTDANGESQHPDKKRKNRA